MKKGFTIIELLIVIGISAVLCAVVLVSVSRFRNVQVLKNGTEEVVSILYKARARTLAGDNGRAYGVTVTAGTRTLTLYSLNGASKVTEETVELPSQLTLATTNTEYLFKKLTGDVDPGVVTLTVSGETRTVTIQTTGVVSAN